MTTPHTGRTGAVNNFARTILASVLLSIAQSFFLAHGLSLTNNPSSSSGSVVRSLSRSRFLSSAAGGSLFTASASFVGAMGGGAESCSARDLLRGVHVSERIGNNPRYLDYELEMKYGDDKGVNPRTRGVLVRRFTGDSTPYTFPIRPVRFVKEWPEKAPFGPDDFRRSDESDDGSFYTVPRLVYHIDEPAVASLTQYYRRTIPEGSAILDICSSWVSHYPLEFPTAMKRISGTGMNALELKLNDQLTDFQARNLNVEPILPYNDDSFDFVTCVVSIDYLIRPIEVLREVNRVLKPGGKVILSQSNRCFPTKAIAMWLTMNDRQHLELINGYLQYAGRFINSEAFDITAEGPNQRSFDPMFIVQAEKA